jgi:TDG/mug DNA glycosylase family protein
VWRRTRSGGYVKSVHYSAAVSEVLPDVLEPGLKVVFCGTAPGAVSAKVQAYYAGPGNAFWQALHLTGLTPFELVPAEFERLPGYGIGLTDICKVSSGSDAEVEIAEFDVAGLQEKIGGAEPGHLAFNGKNAARGALERDVAYGLQEEQVGGAPVWVLPSTSGRARRFWKLEPWQELALACGAEPNRT